MPAILTPLSVEQVHALQQGDEHAFEQLVRSRFDLLVEKAGLQLGSDAAAAPRVAMGLLMSAWTDRAQFTSPHALDDYLDDALPHRVAEELRRRASLHRFELHEGVQVATPVAKAGMTAQQAWDEISARLHVSAEELAAHREESRRLARKHTREHVDRVSRQSMPVGMIAIGVVLLIAAVIAMRYMDRGSAELALTRAIESADARLLQSAVGQRGTIELLDQSTAQLGAGSTLRIPRGFGNTLRGLQLDGAAHFAVSPGNDLDFQVRVRNSAVVAVGTEFSVRAYDDDPEIMIMVREGKVRVTPVRGELSSQNLDAGDALAIAADGSVRTPSAQEVTLAFSWIDGALRLENVTVDRALAKLRRWHNVRAELEDSTLGSRLVTTSLTLESSGQALDALTRAADLTVDYVGEQMVLRDARGAAASATGARPK